MSLSVLGQCCLAVACVDMAWHQVRLWPPLCAGVIPRAIHQIFGYLDSINSEYT